MDLETKATAVTALSADAGVVAADEATGIVEAIVSVTGVVDEDSDLIIPGAYTATLAKRTPKGIFHHKWDKWVAKTLEIAELMPGDPRLPATTRAGAPWPADAGGLWVKCQFNLNTTTGRDAFENVRFFDDTEWSIGYKVRPGDAVKTRDGVRKIKAVDLYEYSPVLFGAAPLSGTLSVKAAGGPEEEAAEDDEDEADETADDIEDPNEPGSVTLFDLIADEPTDGEPAPRAEGEASLLDDEPDAEQKGSRASLDRSPRKNWVENTGELPGYVREIARSIHEKRGMPLDQAIPIAIAQVKKWAAGGGDVDAGTRAKAAAAVAQWEALKAKHRGRAAKDAYDPALEVGPHAGHLDPAVWAYTGPLESLLAKAAGAARDRLAGSAEAARVRLEGTWIDHVIATVMPEAGAPHSYRLPLTVSGDDVALGEPEPVLLSVGAQARDGQEEAWERAAAVVEHVAAELGAARTVETKAGRVLSAKNEALFRKAVEALIEVGRSAGIRLVGPDETETPDEVPSSYDVTTDQDTTAPSVRATNGKVLLDPELHRKAMEIRAAVAARRKTQA